MVAVFRASWLSWRLPRRAERSGDLFAEAKLLHRLGFHTAAVMTARAAIDRLIRSLIVSDSKSSRGLAIRCPTGQCLERLVRLEIVSVDVLRPVKKAVGKLSKFCHGRDVDRATAADLLAISEDAIRTLSAIALEHLGAQEVAS